MVYKSYFKFLPIKQNVFETSLINMYRREKSYMVKRYVIDSFLFWLYFNHLYNLCWQKYKYLQITHKLIITSKTSAALTLVKSPMAQKTWSKEQVGYKYFNIKLYINVKNFTYITNIHNNDTVFIYFLLKYIKNLVFISNTPIMLLKYAIIFLNLNYKNNLYI